MIEGRLQILPGGADDRAARGQKLGALLVADGAITPEQLDWALARQRRAGCRLGRVLTRNGLIGEDALARALARQRGLAHLPPGAVPGDGAAMRRLGAGWCQRHLVLPLRRSGALTPVLAADPAAAEALRPELQARLGPVAIAAGAEGEIITALAAHLRAPLVARAETALPGWLSCRTALPRLRAALILPLAGLAALALAAPVAAFTLLAALSLLALLGNTLLQISGLAARAAPPLPAAAQPVPHRLPPVSLLVPLYRERRIAAGLIANLGRLDYPAELLDILLLVEEADGETRDAIAAAAPLPPTMRVVTVPPGSVRTKPRAMNYALGFCRGRIIGIYDAEDRPEPDQIARAAAQFATAPPRIVCLQGRLSWYNAARNPITRCFAVEYATWFHLALPGLVRAGAPVPLGGTTLFFRREALEELGGWDAHNVTEDADLGLRLFRRGWRVAMLDSGTGEEAVRRPWPWIRQRSRWLKGYAATYAVAMRHPARLWSDLGPWNFLAVQMLFLGTFIGCLTLPVLWSFWALFLGLPHPWTGLLPWGLGMSLALFMFLSGAIHLAGHLVALRRAGLGHLWPWALACPVYFLMLPLAAVKALAELIWRPFWWDKTSHGGG